jgi:transcriptional regulator with XRE-family HTH domain
METTIEQAGMTEVLIGLPLQPSIGYDFAMSIGPYVQAWRISRGHSVSALALKAAVSESTLESIESEELDPTVSILQGLAAALEIPVSWLYADPRHLAFLTDSDDDGAHSVDPVIEHVLRVAGRDPEMYVLLTAILQNADPKLVRAAEASLRSLAKQSKQPTVPWQSRPSGHFEPPSD